MKIVTYKPQYAHQLVKIFKAAVMSIDQKFYETVQKQAWIGNISDSDYDSNWLKRFANTQPLIAVDGKNNDLDGKSDRAIGFIEYITNQNHLGQYDSHSAYIDCLFVHPDYQKQGVAQMLVDKVLGRLAQANQHIGSEFTQQTLLINQQSTTITSKIINENANKMVSNTINSANSISIWVHASKNAKSFFIKQGFKTQTRQQVYRCYDGKEIVLERYLMRKGI